MDQATEMKTSLQQSHQLHKARYSSRFIAPGTDHSVQDG